MQNKILYLHVMSTSCKWLNNSNHCHFVSFNAVHKQIAVFASIILLIPCTSYGMPSPCLTAYHKSSEPTLDPGAAEIHPIYSAVQVH